MPITNEIIPLIDTVAESIARTIKDYVNNVVCDENDKDHVLKWVSQFDEYDLLFVLKQTDLILKEQHFTKDNVEILLDKAIK
ncbi:hypothetical protein DD582_33720, partial [Klebsiella pneumoniae]|uniref:hypothetical protein n=1 Tax=Klebsiella pneumoniae TaxID=573 RepID=UPI001024E630